jgi:hypothetical protein
MEVRPLIPPSTDDTKTIVITPPLGSVSPYPALMLTPPPSSCLLFFLFRISTLALHTLYFPTGFGRHSTRSRVDGRSELDRPEFPPLVGSVTVGKFLTISIRHLLDRMVVEPLPRGK